MIEVQKPVAPEKVTPLKPSEAMRLGRMLYPQVCTGTYFAPQADGTVAACAAGAMAAGYGFTPDDDATYAWPAEWAPVFKRCPECGDLSVAPHLIPHLNDNHGWPTESIANWLEGLGL